MRALVHIPQFLSVLTLSLYNDNKQAALGLSLRASDNLLFKCSHTLPYGDLVYGIQILGEQSSEYRDHMGSVFEACRVLCLFFLWFLMLSTFSVVSLRVPSSWMFWRSCTLFPGSVSFHVFFPTRMAALLGFLQYHVSGCTCHIACKAHFIVIVCLRWVHTLQARAPGWQR